MLCDSVKPALYFFKIPRARIGFTRIRLIIAHVTLAHATLNNRGTARLKKRKASYSDRLASSLKSYSIEENVRSKIFASEINKKD
jgi:uncharacterized C2H2 Zn-finger protein